MSESQPENGGTSMLARMLAIEAEHKRAELADDGAFRWDRMLDEGGLPVHMPMGVTAEGRGPTGDNEAHHYLCWCADRRCLLNLALRDAWLAGMRHGLSTSPAAPDYVAHCWVVTAPDGETLQRATEDDPAAIPVTAMWGQR